MDLSQLYLFIGACLALVAIPGPAVAFIVARSVSEGTSAGVKTAAGIAIGNLCQALAATFGLAAVLVSYPSVYQVIKYAGASYLIYLGFRSFFAKTGSKSLGTTTQTSTMFRQGALVGLLNPKVALFLLAFLPQFTNPENGEMWEQLLSLGLGFVFIGWLGDTTWALCAGLASSRLRKEAPFHGVATRQVLSTAWSASRPLYWETERNRRRPRPLKSELIQCKGIACNSKLSVSAFPIHILPMNYKLRLLRSFILFLAIGLLPLTHAQDPSIGATKHGNARFFELHASFLKRAAEAPAGVVFLGDSITEGWTKVPEIWEAAWGKYQPANFGIGGDRTQHVIWRIEQGELDKVSPKVVVLMIGTNNTGDDSAKDIAAANRKIVAMIQEALPETKILLLAVFPRGPRNARGTADPWEMKMKKIRSINADLAKLDNGKSIRYLDLGPKFMSADGTIAHAIMPDQLHLSPAGYQIWVEGMAPLLSEMMQ